MNKQRIYSLFFKLLLGIILLNLNGLLYLFFSSTGLISPLILLLSVYIITNSKNKTFSKLFNIYFLYVLIYLSTGLISLIISLQVGDNTLSTIADVIKTLILLSAIYLGYKQELQNSNAILRFTCWLIITSVVLSFGLDYINIAAIQDNYRTEMRMSGFFANPNELAAQALFAILSIQFLYKQYKSKQYKLILLIAFLICTYSMFMAFSRSIFLAFFVLLFLQLFVYKGISLKSTFFVIFSIILLSISLPILYENVNTSLQKRIDTSLQIFDVGLSDRTTGGRLNLINEAFVYINENPFLGIGIGNMQRIEGVGGVHNAYLAVWGNAGFFVLLYFLFFLVILLKKLHKYSIDNRNTFILFLILTICINGLSKACLLYTSPSPRDS